MPSLNVGSEAGLALLVRVWSYCEKDVERSIVRRRLSSRFLS